MSVKIDKFREGVSNKTYDDKPIKYVEYKATERINREQAFKCVKKMIADNRLDMTKKYILAGAWDCAGWRSGKIFKPESFNINDLYDFNAKYNLKDVKQTLKNFVLYELEDDEEGGNDKHNDCFYNCLVLGLNQNKNLLPAEINTAPKTKIYLNKKRDAKISLDDIKKLLPLLEASDISIQVDDKICTEILKHNIQLNLKNGHYTVQLDENTFLKQMRKQMLKFTEKSSYQRQMYTYFVDIENNKLFFYNGEKIEEFENNSEVTTEIFRSKHKIYKKVSNMSELKTN
jgi:hypothetical protein